MEVWVLNAAEYGVPQIRERMFVVGSKFGRELGTPQKTHSLELLHLNRSQLSVFDHIGQSPAVTLWDAISDLPELEAREGKEEQPYIMEPRNDYQIWIRDGS